MIVSTNDPSYFIADRPEAHRSSVAIRSTSRFNDCAICSRWPNRSKIVYFSCKSCHWHAYLFANSAIYRTVCFRCRITTYWILSHIFAVLGDNNSAHHCHPHHHHHHNRLLGKQFDSCKALRGFLMMITRQGKMLYISENASDYLGHSVVYTS